MAVSPADGEDLVIQDVRRTYQQAEHQLIEKLADRMEKGRMDIPNWASRKLSELEDFTDEVKEDVIQNTIGSAKDDVQQGIRKAYAKGAQDVDEILMGAGKAQMTGTFTQVDEEQVKALSRAIQGRLNSVDQRVLRSADDAYRQVVAQATREGVAGVSTRRQVAQEALNQFADRGITAFVSSGRSWSMQGYTEMATRTALGRSSLNGSMNRMKQNNHDLAIVGTSYEPCPLCIPWEGRILSVTGNSKKYPSVQEAKDGGLYHPNCTHSITPYVSGITKKPDIRKEKKLQRYKNRQQQRYNERKIRQWKKRKAACITDKDCAKARAKVKEWKGRQKKFINKTGRYRKTSREQFSGIDMETPKTTDGRFVNSKDWMDDLSDKEKRAIKNYQGANYGDVRKLQMGESVPPRIEDTLENMKKGLKTAPTYQGKAYRGLKNLDEDQIQSMVNSDSISLEAFNSASKKEGVAKEFTQSWKGKGALMEIDSKTAKDISALGEYGEQEVLFEKGTRFVGKEIIEEEDYYRVIVEEVKNG